MQPRPGPGLGTGIKMNDEKAQDNKVKSPSPLQVFGSVIAAAFGVQSSKNRERDFKRGKFSYYAIAGVVFTLVFLVSIYTIVSVVLESSR